MLDNRLHFRDLSTKDSYIKRLQEMGIKTLRDLFMYFPRDYKNESEFTSINELRTDCDNVISVKIESIFSQRTKTGKDITRAVVSDNTGEIPVVWFNQGHLQQMFFKGSQIILTGKLKFDRGKSFLMSPKYEKPKNILIHTGRIVPVYSEYSEITSKWLREKIHALLRYVNYFEEYLPEWIINEESLMSFKDAVYNVHFPKNEETLNKARERLAFDEVFLLQLLALKRKKIWQDSQVATATSSINLEAFLESLPYKLTNAQIKVIDEILSDLKKNYPMIRLIQGDVGSGKTVVAAAIIYLMKSQSKQSVLMAPTEILAKQHYRTLISILSLFSINTKLLTGSTSDKERNEILCSLSSGTCDLLIGTHAVIQDDINFNNLGLAVIDEQHRFGVKQREILKRKGSPHLLNLSATPIPRTLALTLYGDQDLSVIDELPPGRQTVITRIVPEEKRKDAYYWIRDQIKKGRQAFIICPLVEDSDYIEAKAAVDEYEHLAKDIFPDLKIALLHGRMKSGDKDAIMKSFSDKEFDILLSTSVVEVGIDVPNATIMLIEGAERFGLAQLHQFRGRVGRGADQSYCFLFTDKDSGDALQRLKYMVQYSSGFDLAEKDLEIRGPGEVFGLKQSGVFDLKMASYSDSQLLNRARKSAEKLIALDLHLREHSSLRTKVATLEEKTMDSNV